MQHHVLTRMMRLASTVLIVFLTTTAVHALNDQPTPINTPGSVIPDPDHDLVDARSHATDAAHDADADAAHDAGAGHDHSAHGAKAQSPLLIHAIKWLGAFHPVMIHFPIGLLVAAAVAEFLFIRTKRARFDNAAQFCLWFAAAGALAAATLGWFNAGFHIVDDNWVLTTHRWLGTSVALLSLTAIWLSAVSHQAGKETRLPAYRGVLFLTVSLVGATGFLGGVMIYGFDHYAW